MAELPELTILQRQMQQSLAGQTIKQVEIRQEKCLNLPAARFVALLTGRRICGVTRRGKWLCLGLEPDYHLLINLGMGADLWHSSPGQPLPAKYQFRVELADGSGFTCRFWWFGHLHLLTAAELAVHAETSKLGPSPLEITPAEFAAIAGRYPRSPVKSLILDQEKLSGIGNAYAHDILWQARLHPLRRLGSLSSDELQRYYAAVQAILRRGLELGDVEADFYRAGGNANNWEAFMLIGYKKGKPCPACGAPIEELKTGATKTYICPRCQPE